MVFEEAIRKIRNVHANLFSPLILDRPVVEQMKKVYIYEGCDTCRRALRWLKENQFEIDALPIRETPPKRAELKKALKAFNGNLRRIFNVSGGDYRSMGLKDRLPTMSEDEAFDLLESNGNLVKRPFLIVDESGYAGFDEKVWTELLR